MPPRDSSSSSGPDFDPLGTLTAEHHRSRRRARSEPVVPPGKTLGRYVVLDVLGHGGMGTVLKAYDGTLDRAIAIKLLHPGTEARHARRLTREAQALARLSHPNVVHVYEVGRDGDQWFIAMELVHGQTLRKWQSRRHPWRKCVRTYLQAGAGLHAAHEAGLVHRDFKPDNCIIDERGRIRVLDFGLVREADVPSTDVSSAGTYSAPLDDPHLTRHGVAVGTPAYMSLEQLDRRPADARSDQFSFCVALYEALYGERPFDGRTMNQRMVAIKRGELRAAPRGTRVPARVRRLLTRGLSADPDSRWPSMDVLLAELQRMVAPSRTRAPVVLAAGLAVALGVILSPGSEAPTPCQGSRAQLDAIWDQARREQVEHAIVGTALPYAQDTWQRIGPALDTYADAWVHSHRQACEATSVRQEQSTEVMDLRMACLQRRRVELREVVAVLAEANETRVNRAMRLLPEPRDLLRCDDIEALRAALPPPEDPAVAVKVEELRDRLAAVDSLSRAGEYPPALADAEAIDQEAAALRYGPLMAEAMLRRGQLEQRLGRITQSEEHLEQAFMLAAQHGPADVEAIAASELLLIVGEYQGRHEQGLWWGRVALAQSRGLRDDPLIEAEVLAHIGIVLQRERKLEDSLDHIRRGVAITEDVLGPEHPQVAFMLNNIGNGLRIQGRNDEALAHMQRSYEILASYYGEGHPMTANSLDNVAIMLKRLGKLDESLEHHRRALVLLEGALGSDHPDVALALLDMGDVLKRKQQPDDAIAHIRRAQRILERTVGPRHPAIAAALDNIGVILFEQGRLDEAQDHHQRALTMFEAVAGADHPDTAESLMGLATVALARGDAETSRAHAQRALAILEASELPGVTIAEARFLLARALWAGDPRSSKAIALARRARDEYAAAGEPAADDRAELDGWLETHSEPAALADQSQRGGTTAAK